MSNGTSTGGKDPKTISIISYITLIGWIIAIVMNNPKQSLASFHIRQMTGILICSFALSLLNYVPMMGSALSGIGGILVFIMWILGFVSAVQGQDKPIPVVGEYFQEWFRSL